MNLNDSTFLLDRMVSSCRMNCSETVKFGHVTFFWNGNRSGYFNQDLEKYEEIPSDIGIPFNVQPKMKALEIAHKARDAILSRNFDQVVNEFKSS
jgi:2,3-bisphosphoglycerate-independent phosphoglycerate mutase